MRRYFCAVAAAVLLGCGAPVQPQNPQKGPAPRRPHGGIPQLGPANAHGVAAAFSPDGKWLLTQFTLHDFEKAEFEPPPVWTGLTLWDVSSGKILKTYPREYCGDSLHTLLAFLPDGKHAFSAGEGRWRVFEVPGGKVVREISGLLWPCLPRALSGDGTRLLTSGIPGGIRGIQIWDVATGKMIQLHEIPTGIGNGWLSHDGKRALVEGGISDDVERINLQMWDFERGKPVLSLKRDGTKWWGPPVAFSPDGKCFVAGWWGAGDQIILCDTSTGRKVRQLFAARTAISKAPAVSFTSDGKYLLVGGAGRLERVAVTDGKPVWSIPLTKEEHCQVFSPDGTIALTTRGWMGQFSPHRMTFTLWDTVEGDRLRELKFPE